MPLYLLLKASFLVVSVGFKQAMSHESVALFQFPVFSETKIGETKVLVYKSFVVFFQ